MVALVTHGNTFLFEGRSAPELFPAHTTFQFVADIRFSDIEGSTAAWFERLRGRGVRRLWLVLASAGSQLRLARGSSAALGSWNDVYFEDEAAGKRYAAVSDELYTALTTAIVAAAN